MCDIETGTFLFFVISMFSTVMLRIIYTARFQFQFHANQLLPTLIFKNYIFLWPVQLQRTQFIGPIREHYRYSSIEIPNILCLPKTADFVIGYKIFGCQVYIIPLYYLFSVAKATLQSEMSVRPSVCLS